MAVLLILFWCANLDMILLIDIEHVFESLEWAIGMPVTSHKRRMRPCWRALVFSLTAQNLFMENLYPQGPYMRECIWMTCWWFRNARSRNQYLLTGLLFPHRSAPMTRISGVCNKLKRLMLRWDSRELCTKHSEVKLNSKHGGLKYMVSVGRLVPPFCFDSRFGCFFVGLSNWSFAPNIFYRSCWGTFVLLSSIGVSSILCSIIFTSFCRRCPTLVGDLCQVL